MPGRPKDILIGFEARRKLLSGASKLVRAVATTHGPFGKTSLIQRLAGIVATKDGLTVAREIFLPDPVENMGARVIGDACVKVNQEAGDGTTAAAILAMAFLEKGTREISAGRSATDVASEIGRATETACAFVRDMAIPVAGKDVLERIAFVAGNGDEEIARLMADACMAVGKDGAVAVEDGKGVDSVLEFKEGLEIAKGAANAKFLAGKPERVVEGALVAVILHPLQAIDDVKDLLETASQWPRNELVVFSPAVIGEALSTMVLNDSKDVVKCVAIQTGGHRAKETLEDVAALSGAVLVDTFAGMPNRTWNAEWFGTFRKVTVKIRSSRLEAYDENSKSIQDQVVRLKAELALASSDFDKDLLRNRIARLTGGFAILKMGGVTEIAMKERRARVEDVLGTVRAALRGGIVPGGGIPCFLAGKTAGGAMADAFGAPLRSLARQAGMPWISCAPVEGTDPWIGWDFVQGKKRNLGEPPLVADAALAVEAGIRAAGSVARTLILVGASVSEKAWKGSVSGRPGRRS